VNSAKNEGVSCFNNLKELWSKQNRKRMPRSGCNALPIPILQLKKKLMENPTFSCHIASDFFIVV
jgi:hypothetical protein